MRSKLILIYKNMLTDPDACLLVKLVIVVITLASRTKCQITCPPDFEQEGNSCYKFSTVIFQYNEAVNFCANLDKRGQRVSTLAMPDDHGKCKEVLDFAHRKRIKNFFWIGITDKGTSGRTWYWQSSGLEVDKSSTDHCWRPGLDSQSAAPVRENNCVTVLAHFGLKINHGWESDRCDDFQYALCQISVPSNTSYEVESDTSTTSTTERAKITAAVKTVTKEPEITTAVQDQDDGIELRPTGYQNMLMIIMWYLPMVLIPLVIIIFVLFNWGIWECNVMKLSKEYEKKNTYKVPKKKKKPMSEHDDVKEKIREG